ncbi:hypothetical protein BC351_08365 [Paenibacillus ferrarius]|uniref:DUF3995 domain-containing protein n=1 Tax=Paenibacillus ferrarius TaxID=1469647 RepID=A0A1V4HA07_9BACL|nr:DUF3995 domain-containing protein [Paenibacillus ferrarius]OPH48472.1 hypothetical protein BC351_08365 [Paenibacillus ferrarius]
MKLVMTLSTVSLLTLISIVHVYWAFGGRWGKHAAIPSQAGENRPAFVPGKMATLFVAVLLLIACLILLVQSGYTQYLQASMMTRIGCVVCGSVFLLRAIGDFRFVGFFKKINHSVFAKNDTWLYSPLCLYCGVTFMMVGLRQQLLGI